MNRSTVPLTRRKAYFNALKEDALTFDIQLVVRKVKMIIAKHIK